MCKSVGWDQRSAGPPLHWPVCKSVGWDQRSAGPPHQTTWWAGAVACPTLHPCESTNWPKVQPNSNVFVFRATIRVSRMDIHVRRVAMKRCQSEGCCGLTAVRQCKNVQATGIAALDRTIKTLPVSTSSHSGFGDNALINLPLQPRLPKATL